MSKHLDDIMEKMNSLIGDAYKQGKIDTYLEFIDQESLTQEVTEDNTTVQEESSRQHTADEPTFYIPNENEWRREPDNSKQEHGEMIHTSIGSVLTGWLEHITRHGEELYEFALRSGVCAEQARLFLKDFNDPRRSNQKEIQEILSMSKEEIIKKLSKYGLSERVATQVVLSWDKNDLKVILNFLHWKMYI